MKIVALLESMWGWGGHHAPGTEAPRFFRINPENFSGRRLYRLCGDANLIVTNCCRLVQQSASHHGEPDVDWVRQNLCRAQAAGCDLFLICGAVARETYLRADVKYLLNRVLIIDHPAARRWSKQRLALVADQISTIRRRVDSEAARV